MMKTITIITTAACLAGLVFHGYFMIGWGIQKQTLITGWMALRSSNHLCQKQLQDGIKHLQQECNEFISRQSIRWSCRGTQLFIITALTLEKKTRQTDRQTDRQQTVALCYGHGERIIQVLA